MEIWLVTLILFVSLLLCIALGLPIAFCFGGVTIIFTYLLWGPKSIAILPLTAFESGSNYVILAVPFFILMANILESAGLADGLYDMMHKWMGRLPGGLAIGTIVVCAIFAAMVGVSAVGTITMGLIGMPSMFKRGYSKYLVLGSISAGGTLGILIPPSVIMILYAFLTEESVGKLYMAAFIPGLLLAFLYVIYIAIRCHISPELGPPIRESVGFREKLLSLKAVILPALLIMLVLGAIYTGICTATESAALGAFGALACTFIYRTFSWKVFFKALQRTLLITSMTVFILFAATSFTQVYTALGAPDMLNSLIKSLPVSRWFILAMMMLIIFILGMFLDPAGIIMICTPVFLPVVEVLGFDTIWFGILFTINLEMGYVTPPFGINLFIMKSILPKGLSMEDVYRGIMPFVMLGIIGLIIVILFPSLALWLPSTMIKK